MMDTSKLIAVGLTEHQAGAYVLLLENGSVSPAEVAASLKLSRTNAYKILDKLVGFQLAAKKEAKKKIIYEATNPIALSNLVAEQRNIATAREEAASSLMTDLLAKYHTLSNQPSGKVYSGKTNVVAAYRAQLQQKAPIYFLRSRSDIPIMGFDTMHELRTAPARHDINRFGIIPDLKTGSTSNPKIHERSNLQRTWVRQEDYTAPVEWSVCGSTLLIVVFDTQPQAIMIESPLIAEAFQQIWQMLDTMLKTMPYYNDLPRKKSATG